MPDWEKVGTALSGFGAGLQGQGPQWQMARVAEQRRAEEARIQQDAERQRQMLQDMYMVQQSLANNDVQSAQYHLSQRIERLAANGEDTSGTQRILQLTQADPNRALNEVSSSIKFFTDMRGSNRVPAELQVMSHIQDVIDNPQNYDPEYVQAVKIRARIEPGYGTLSSSERIALSPDMTDKVAESQADIAGAKSGASEEAKLGVQQLKLPQLRAAVKQAEDDAGRLAKIAEEDRSNENAFSVYNTAMSNLVSSLDNTATGPFVGMIPAITANQQIAKSASAAMAPVLKQLFRASGEGVFTDRDQQLLLDMVPGRESHPETIAAAASAIDAIVRAKLRIPNDYGTDAAGSYEEWKRRNNKE